MISNALCLQSFFLFCIIVMQVTTSFQSESIENEIDRVALHAFKSNILDDPQGILNSWNDSRHFCEWEGITCGHRHKRVTILSLLSRGLHGSLSPFIGNLSFVQKIDLSNNSIQGKIPPEIGHLFRLEDLKLSNNSMVGEIPANLSHCSKLKFLYLGFNNLDGKIPSEFVSLCNLETLALHFNSLTGGIPHFLGNLTSLEKISIGVNNFGGNIPDSLGQLKKLTTLGLDSNNLSGIIPPSIYNLSFLVNFSLTANNLHGIIPPNLGLILPHLIYYHISHNYFSGSIPVSLSNASKLETIHMGKNSFSGKLSIDFKGMQHLEFLGVNGNNLGSGEDDEMSFINSLVNCSNLRVFIIAENQFRGQLPHSIGNLSTKLQLLCFDTNQLFGTIPAGIGNLINLEFLSLHNNQFSGLIPKEIGKLDNLNSMVLGNNKLIGEIPSSLGNLSKLSEFILFNNKLSGVIPSSLGNLKQLIIFDLSQNDLGGTIPKQIFEITYLSIILSLAQNQLIGSIPPNIGNLQALSTFDVSDNNLSREIPKELALCSSLEYLYIEGNSFLGSIPSSLSSLKGIQEIDLSRNNFSGQIPKFLGTLSLKKLNLSFNDLEGEVPTKGIFTNSSAISIMGNSNQLCGGVVELQLPRCTNNDFNKGKIPQLYKILILVASVLSGFFMISLLIFCWLKKRKGKQPSQFGPTLLEFLNLSYERILKATDQFSSRNLIGVGSYGSVYKAILDQEGTIIAIKVLNLQNQRASKSFMAECKALRNIRHRNLVKVVTSCSSIDFQGNDFKAIVYEYMPNESLEKWLHPAPEIEEEQNEVQNLTLLQRLSIAIDVASAIDYLHHHCPEQILHCDLKPSNILLDSDMIAHVGDFGLARFLPKVSNPNQSSSIGVRGTIGYAAPEYGLGSEASTNGDVYSYGILLLEMITKRRPTDLMFDGSLNLHNFARLALPDRVMDIVDPVLLNDDEEMAATRHFLKEANNSSIKECLISMMRIGVACSMESPQDRMNITNVVNELQQVRNTVLQARIVLKEAL